MHARISTRSWIWTVALTAATALVPLASTDAAERGERRPNILFLLADQWRADALGCAGDPTVRTPNLDRLSAEGIWFLNAVSGCPVCCPYRASLMTGQRPLTHGVFVNDVPLRDEAVTIAEVLSAAGYDTGYIGKWHLDGRGRSSFTPPERRQGFHYWKALECTHEYFRSPYYADGPEKLFWPGYDAIAQTNDAREYLKARAGSTRPFLLFLAWGPPHDPYHKAPRRFLDLYPPEKIRLRPNVPESDASGARRDLSGYYAHCTALDECVGVLRRTLRETGLESTTILIFTSDHGDLLGSHGGHKKQQPWDECIRVPFFISWPGRFGRKGRRIETPIGTEDIMPTLLGLCGVPAPAGVEGMDFSGHAAGGPDPSDGAALISCPQPFGQWHRAVGGREYRGIRTSRYTYVRDRDGPWLLFDSGTDPYQTRNLVDSPEHAALRASLDALLRKKLDASRDEFLPGSAYVERWGYQVDATGTVPYTD